VDLFVQACKEEVTSIEQDKLCKELRDAESLCRIEACSALHWQTSARIGAPWRPTGASSSATRTNGSRSSFCKTQSKSK
ncbi:hypothetical protein HAX54_009010, partial [Datura stramonium]|nr:hypothetical protein [Datura stramonium]